MSMSSSSLLNRLQLGVRISITVGFAIVLFGVPYLTQVERVRHEGLWGWGLYRSHGVGVMDLHYTLVRGAESTRLDRAEAIGGESLYALLRRQRAPHLKQVVPQTERICRYVRATYGEEATVTLDAQVSAWEGWTSLVEDLSDVCGTGKPALQRSVKSIRLRRARVPRTPLKKWWAGKWRVGEKAP